MNVGDPTEAARASAVPESAAASCAGLVGGATTATPPALRNAPPQSRKPETKTTVLNAKALIARLVGPPTFNALLARSQNKPKSSAKAVCATRRRAATWAATPGALLAATPATPAK